MRLFLQMNQYLEVFITPPPPLQVVKKMETSVSGDPAIPFKVKTAFVLVFLNK